MLDARRLWEGSWKNGAGEHSNEGVGSWSSSWLEKDKWAYAMLFKASGLVKLRAWLARRALLVSK